MWNIKGRLEDWYFDLSETEGDFSVLGHALRGKINGQDVETDIVLGRTIGLDCVITQDTESDKASFYVLGEPLAELEEQFPGFKGQVLDRLQISEELLYVEGNAVGGMVMPGAVYTVDEFNELYDHPHTSTSRTIATREIFDWRLVQPHPTEPAFVPVAPDKILESGQRCLLEGYYTDETSGEKRRIRTSWLVAVASREEPYVLVTRNIHGKETLYTLGAVNAEYQSMQQARYPDCGAAIARCLPDWKPPAATPDDPSP